MKTHLEGRGNLGDLGDGLILRRSTPEDAERLSAFNAHIHGDPDEDKPDERVGIWTRDLLEKPHPTFNPGDFTIVEETHSGKIVSSLNLISQTWSYNGINFKVGRPELVGTLPEYRNRGLVRRQFEVIHKWSSERGQLVQAITGIPYYYRQFGYEMALDLDGGRAGHLLQVPQLKNGEHERYQLRTANETDIGFIAELYQAGCQRSLVSCVRNSELWQYEINGKSECNITRSKLSIIETQTGEPVGFLCHNCHSKGTRMIATTYELKPGVSWAAVTPGVIRYLMATGKECVERGKQAQPASSFGFWLGTEHPVYQVLHDRLVEKHPPYTWYLRVPDLPGFIRLIAPVLETRLEQSVFCGHSGEFLVTFYKNGMRLKIENGQLVTCESWQPRQTNQPLMAAFPGLTFLQLLFGYRTLDELHYAFPDCWYASDEIYGLLGILFPKRSSDVWPIA